MINSRLINTKVAGGGGCTDIVDNYDPFGGNGVALYQLNGNANDESGNYDGTATSVTYGTGVFGQAGVFNGSSSYVNLPINIPITLNSFTLSAWCKVDSLPSNTAGLFQMRFGGTYPNSNETAIYANQNTGNYRFLHRNTTNNEISFESLAPALGTYNHFVATYDGSTYNVYLNGVNVLSRSFSLIYSYTSLSDASLGVYSINFYQLDGSIDQVRIFNTALTPLEVEALYTEELCICDGTVDTLDILGDGSCIATYQLDGNANDLSGNYSGTPTDVSYGVGEFDLAGFFNGSSSYVDLGATNQFSSSNVTVSMWINPVSVITSQMLIANQNGGSFAEGDLFIGIRTDGYIGYEIGQSASIYEARYATTTQLTANAWQHILMTFDSSLGTTIGKIYVNGTLQSTSATYAAGGTFSGDVFIGTLPLNLGKRNISGNELWYGGSIDQVRIFNKALDQNDVDTLYAETACTKAACTGTTNTLDILGDGSCVAAYPLDGSPADLSGNYNGVQGGNVTYPQGYFDLAASFGGSGKGIDLPSNTPVSGQINCSISLWFNVLSNSKKETLVRFANNDEVLLRINTNGTLDLIGVRQSNTTYISYTTAGSYNNGVWHHLVMTRESGSIKFYINNSLDNTLSWNNTFIVAANETAIGYDGFASASVLSGSIDQVRIFNKALSASEVTTLYNETPCN